jgi:hypothetical protein
LHYQAVWHLDEWQLSFQFLKLEGRYGQTTYNLEARKATMALSTEWETEDIYPLSKESVEKTAKHEMLHVMLAPLSGLTEVQNTSGREIDGNEHALINKLLKLLK